MRVIYTKRRLPYFVPGPTLARHASRFVEIDSPVPRFHPAAPEHAKKKGSNTHQVLAPIRLLQSSPMCCCAVPMHACLVPVRAERHIPQLRLVFHRAVRAARRRHAHRLVPVRPVRLAFMVPLRSLALMLLHLLASTVRVTEGAPRAPSKRCRGNYGGYGARWTCAATLHGWLERRWWVICRVSMGERQCHRCFKII